ncbi:MAG: NADH-quinone oxidoreductase subunit C [Verrucomicrobiota bacterium]|nr:NADH-quinone oxidoreductase subunit C [Verrucomicrobiota bacterium]
MNTDYLFVKFPTLTYERPTNSFVIPPEIALEVARYLKDDPMFRMDMCTNCTAVDWLPTTNIVKRKTIEIIDGKQVESVEEIIVDKPAYLETVYHLVSVEKKKGPLIIRVRTKDRIDTRVPSLTPVWRGCEFQEREAYDLYGIMYEGHPDLRRILMWEGFQDYPMRKDYVEPDDYEYEPTPHDEVLTKAKKHYPVKPV